MRVLSNLGIATKILLVIGILAMLTLSIVGGASLQLTKLSNTTSELIGDEAESVKLASAASEKLAKLHQVWLERLIETDTEKLTGLRGEIDAERNGLGQLLGELKPFMEGDDVATFATIERELSDYHRMMAPIEGLMTAGNVRGAEQIGQDAGGDLYAKIDVEFDTLISRQDKDLDAGAIAAKESAANTIWWLIAASIGGLAIVAAFAVIGIRRTVTGPLGEVVERMGSLARGQNNIEVQGTDRGDEIGKIAKAVLVFRDAAVEKQKIEAAQRLADEEQKRVVDSLENGLGQLAQGDLTAQITAEFSPSYQTVKTNFNEALTSLRGLISTVSESAAGIRTGSGEIAQASEDLARRTEANAASLEETSAAVTQMDGRLKATALAASRTVASADGAVTTVSEGRAITDQAVQAMGRVADGAKGIDSVIEGLDKIAFQTRVLAMNAAVEAGRAGEAGRGFAVVADLVSALAMRSEEEAARAREQLTATQTDIVSAVDMVQRVDGALANISGNVAEVHTLLGQMASDNQAQSTAITEISIAIGTMDQSTQQNAAMVEQTSAAARNLSSEVLTMAEQAAKFNVGNGAPKSFRPASPAQSTAAQTGYRSPVKPLPASISPAGGSDDWASF
ncbi:HAMP domain-containing methyl-accepting chemotaxis protein [Sphingomonas xinjiangensis]|uniref:Methyl-accepting chemotaxis protein n=1 Tax=Sphingomonas xinjiangensis TaxID=643568 RepID=A0A840YN28_9SPHN|nr:methyl-accepting chemotaxis protein [Sphingomonas xinjiangensis]MBB5711476.1 methyl-accepting chemotaxis protein [Sphingomonas xinjiangensis]